nr:MAG TPA: transcription factor-like protein [Caudoviricetes sp.]
MYTHSCLITYFYNKAFLPIIQTIVRVLQLMR